MKNKTNSGQHLGKGIEALIRDNSTESKDNANLFIELNKIIPNKKIQEKILIK